MDDSSDFLIQESTAPVILSTIQAVLGVAILAGNCVTFMALYKAKTLQMSMRLFLLTVAMMDIISGISFIYHSFAVYLILDNYAECIVRYFSVSLTCAVSLNILTIMSVDRIIFITLSSKYNSVVTKKVVMAVILTSWIGPTIAISAGMWFTNRDIKICRFVDLVTVTSYLFFSTPSLTLITIIIVCHVVIFIKTLEQIRKIVRLHVGNDSSKMAVSMNLKATVTTAFVVVPFVVCTTPLHSLFLYLVTHAEARSYRYITFIIDCFFSLHIITSLLNPFIYTWRLKSVKMEVAKYLPFLKIQTSSTSVSFRADSVAFSP